MQVKIKIRTDNAAFEGPYYGPEVARILRELADKVETAIPGHRAYILRDINGNRVGTYKEED